MNNILALLSETERKTAEEWMDKRPLAKAGTGAIGGRFTFAFTPTTIGMTIVVKDNLDKEEIDVTDYDMF